VTYCHACFSLSSLSLDSVSYATESCILLRAHPNQPALTSQFQFGQAHPRTCPLSISHRDSAKSIFGTHSPNPIDRSMRDDAHAFRENEIWYRTCQLRDYNLTSILPFFLSAVIVISPSYATLSPGAMGLPNSLRILYTHSVFG